MILRIVMALVALGMVVLFAALALNRPPWFDPPGFGVRLKTYLTTHTAELRADHVFPELRLRHDARPPEVLLAAVHQAVRTLGWSLEQDPATDTVHAVVSSHLWRFKDDVYITVRGENGGSVLHVRSESRVGRGDLAANTRHVLDLLAAVNVGR